MNPLELRDQGGHSETSKNDWIRLCASISYENKTAHKTSSRNSTLSIPIKFYVQCLLYYHHSQKYFTISENAPGIYDKEILFSFFSVIAMLNTTP